MSKNKQILIFSGIGLAVLGGVAAALILTAPKPEDEPEELPAEEDASLILTEKTEADVESLHIKNGDGEYDIINSGETGEDGAVVWTVAGLEGARLMSSELSAAVANAAALTARQLVEENAAELDKYGLSEPQAEVTVHYTDGTDYSFRFGKETPTSSAAVYFSGEEETTVYTYTKSKLTAFTNDRFGFIETQVMPAADNSGEEEILRFQIERANLEEPIVIEKIPDSGDPDELAVFTYQMTSPYTAYADLTDSPTFIYSLFGLTATSAEWYGMEEKDYKISGLDQPSCVFTLETNKKTYTVTLGNTAAREVTDENGNPSTEIMGVYGMCSEVPDTLFLFDYASIPAASIQPESIISNLFLMPYIYSLKELHYEDSTGQKFTLEFAKVKDATDTENAVYSHKLNGEDYDEQRIKNIYQYLISASGDETYFGDAQGELLAEVRYVYADTSRGEDVVRFYSSTEDRRVIVNVNGKNLFKAKQIYMTQLYQNVENFLNGGEIILTY